MLSRVRLMFVVAVLAVLAVATVGCGGGGGNSSSTTTTTLLQGNAAHRAAILAGYQSFAAGVAYPYMALKLIAPSGSSVANGGPAAASVTRKRIASTPVFVPALNLYVTGPNGAGNVLTLNYFTDAAGTKAAGSVTMTLPAGANGSTNYLSYPVVVPIVVNLTAGNLPCSGTITINFTGNTGANTMTGTLSLPNNKISYTVNLTLSDSLQVAGTITGHENGATINLTNCQGDLFGTLTCDLAISPYGWTGTATGSLVTGVFSTQINTTSGSATSSIDSSTGNLNIVYPDGTKESVSQPLVATLIAGTGTGTGGTGTGGTGGGLSLGAATILGGAAFLTPVTIDNSGQVLTTGFLPGAGQFYASPTVAPIQIASASGSSEESVVAAMNNSGQIVGGTSPDGLAITIDVPLYWSSATAKPVPLPLGTFAKLQPIAITDTGVIVGTTPAHDALVYWQTSTTAPKAIAMPAAATGTISVVAGVSSGGQIAGEIGGAFGNPIYAYWSSPTATPTKMTGVFGNSALNFCINMKSQIAYSDQNGNSYYWASPSAQPALLPAIVTGFTNTATVSAINNSGIIVGSSDATVSSSETHAVFWRTADLSLTDINSLLPAGTTVVLATANSINDLGQTLCSRSGNPTDGHSSAVVLTVK